MPLRRSADRAKELAAALGGTAEAVSLEDVTSGAVTGVVLMNSTSVGMHPDVGRSPVPGAPLASYQLVFDAVYTPVDTQLLQAGFLFRT